MSGYIPGAPGSPDEDDDNDGGNSGSSSGGGGSDDRVLTPDDPDEPTNTKGSGGSSSSGADNDGRSRGGRSGGGGGGGGGGRNRGGGQDRSGGSSSGGGGSDDRVLTPDSPDQPTDTTGSGGTSSPDSGSTGSSSSGGGDDDRVITPDSPDQPTDTKSSGGAASDSRSSPDQQPDEPTPRAGGRIPGAPDDPNVGSSPAPQRPSRQQSGGTQPGSDASQPPRVVDRNEEIDPSNPAVQYQINQQRRALENQYDDLDQDDYQFVLKESGNVDVRLTDSGRDKLRDQAEMNLVNERVRNSVDGDVRSTDIREATEGGYVATVQTADGRTVTRRFVFNEDAAREFRQRAEERRNASTGSQADQTLSPRRESRVSGGGIATDGTEEEFLRQGQMAEDELLERVGATDNDSELPESVAREKRQQLAQQAGVSPDRVVITGAEGGNVQARILSESEARKNRERFGDIDWSFGLGGDEDEVEQFLEDQSAGYDNFARDVVDASEKYGPTQIITRESYDAVDDYLPDWATAVIENQETGRTRSEEFQSGLVQGAVQLGNVPQVAKGVLEGVEYAKFAVDEDNQKVIDQTTEAARAVRRDFESQLETNPGSTSGQFVGSLAVSVGGLGAASKAGKAAKASAASRFGQSSRVARYTGGAVEKVPRYAVQPGEELLSDTATFVARAEPTGVGQKVLNRVPGGRIDNEELALAATSKLSRTIRRAKYDVVNKYAAAERRKLREFAGAGNDRGQLDLTGPDGRRDVDRVDVDPDVNRQYDFDRDFVGEQELDQAQYELREFAEQEQDVRREQLDDVEATRERDVEAAQGPTVDADVLEERRRARRMERESQSQSVQPDQMGEVWDSSLRRIPEDDLRQKLAKQTGSDPAAEAAKLRRRAERRSLDDVRSARRARSRRNPTGMETSVTEDARQRLEEAQRQIEDVGIDTRARERELADSPADYRGDVGVRPTELEGVGETELDLTTELERMQELEQERLQEMQTETRVDPVYEASQEYERETELEREWEREQERERERLEEAASDQNLQDRFWDTSVWENTWETGIADIDDLWNQEFGGR